MTIGTGMVLPKVVAVSRQTHVQQLARKVSNEIFVADDFDEAVELTATIKPQLILFDSTCKPKHVRSFIDTTDKNLNIPIVVVGNDNNVELSKKFIDAGAADFLCGEDDYHRLEQIANQLKNPNQHAASDKSTTDYFANDWAASVSMVGQSQATLNTLKIIELVAKSNCNPVLIVGETGTGKEPAARAVHHLRHPNEQFVAVNCAALTANLLESELFGHVKGSFTSADREKTGLLELAKSGTIFLDEISEMPLELQAKLLRVLQEKTFRKVGGIKDITCTATIIASSNRHLKSEADAGRFRNDLYYRLNICPITIAPLRSPNRKKDITLLAEYFLKTSTICGQKSQKITSLTKLAIEALEKHDWPGNVRELRNVIERAILLETTDKIGLNGILIDPTKCDETLDNPTGGFIKDFSLEKAERELIARALQETGWQKTRAASLLGITRATLYTKVKQYKIQKGSYVVKQSDGETAGIDSSEPVTVT